MDAPEVAVNEPVSSFRLVIGSLGEAQVPGGVVIPRMRFQEGGLVLGTWLDIAPLALEDYWRASMSFLACATPRSLTVYEAISRHAPREDSPISRRDLRRTPRTVLREWSVPGSNR